MVNLIPVVKEGVNGKPISLHKRVLQILKNHLTVHLKCTQRTEHKVTAGKGHYPEKSTVCQEVMPG